jgi:uncharacterized membrane protein
MNTSILRRDATPAALASACADSAAASPLKPEQTIIRPPPMADPSRPGVRRV